MAGLLVRPVPPIFLQPALTAAMTAVARRHPALFRRLASLGDPVYLIDPEDLPLAFLLRPAAGARGLTACRRPDTAAATATIRAPFLTLIDLLEGRLDGDALFFSRDLVIEGDVEAVVALRNAVDGAEIDLLADIALELGPLAGPLRRVAGGAAFLFSRAARDLEALRVAAIDPAVRGSRALALTMRRVEERLAADGGSQ